MARRTVLCFGDSNTYGSVPGEVGGRFPHDVRWPGVLARELGAGWQVIEEGLPGRTTVFDDPLSPYRRGADLGLPRLGAPPGPEFTGAEQKAAELPRHLAQEAASDRSGVSRSRRGRDVFTA